MSSDKKGAASAAAAGAEEPAASRKKEKAQMPLDYVIMSLPVRAEGEKPTVWNQHVDFVTKEKVGRSAQFEIPDLPVGTFDTLMSLSDELGRVDTFAESLCRKIITTLTELYNSPSLFWFSYHCFTLNFYKHITVTMYFHGTASGFATKSLPPWTVNGVSPDAFMAQFAWDEKKFPHKSPLRETVSRVQTLLQRLDGDVRSRVSKYTTAERAMAADARKETGTLATRSLADVVKPSDVVDTEYLTTVFVVVPKHAYKDFGAQYETLSEFVLPRSAVLLKEDSDSGLYSVTVFKRTVDDFKNTARDRRYVVRDVDGDGKSELLVASMTSGDEFCDGLVFALYALDENDNAKLVFTSAERDRYYSVGDDLFAHVGASSADSSLETTERYENGEMTDTGEVTDPANYTPVADTVTFVK